MASAFGAALAPLASREVLGQAGASELPVVRRFATQVYDREVSYESATDTAIRKASIVNEEDIAHVDSMIDLSLNALRLGTASKRHFETIVYMARLSIAIEEQGTVSGLKEVIAPGWRAIMSIFQRCIQTGERIVLRGPELSALNELVTVHKQQTRFLSVREFSRALDKAKAWDANGMNELPKGW